MDVKDDLYELLGVARSATLDEIKRSYRKKVKKLHPDVGGDEEGFKKVSYAYEVLSDKEKKAHYDRFGHTQGRPQPGGNPFGGGVSMEDLMNEFGFGGMGGRSRQRPRQGQNIRFKMKITLEDVFNGMSKRFKYHRKVECGTCNGIGGKSEETCSTCRGSGQLVQQQQTNIGVMQSVISCHTCHGKGKVVKDPCGTCNSSGVVNKEETVSVDVPSGIAETEALEYIGMGSAVKGAPSGALIVEFVIDSHKDFVRNGNDLRTNIRVKYSILVLGGSVEVPTIEGTKIKVSIPKYSKVGDNLRVVNKGLRFKSSENRGDMIIILDIEMPTNIEGEELELVEKLKNLHEGVVTETNK